MVSNFFRYKGTFDFKKLYREGRSFFVSRGFEFNEKKVKYKSDEFEGVWDIKHFYDEYHAFEYSVEWHCYDMVPTSITQPDGRQIQGYSGKIWIRIDSNIVTHYGKKDIAGSQEIFTNSKTDSWLHKVYKKITFRDRDEVLEAEPIMFAQQFITHMKTICEVEAR